MKKKIQQRKKNMPSNKENKLTRKKRYVKE